MRPLTITQRFQASIAADGRKDQTEIKRLTETSEVGNYTINKLHARLNDFAAMTMAINLDLMSYLANWLIAQPWGSFDDDSDRRLADQLIDQSLTNCASLVAARNQLLEKYGVSLDDYERYNIDLPLLKNFIKRAEGKHDAELVDVMFSEIHGFFKGRYP